MMKSQQYWISLSFLNLKKVEFLFLTDSVQHNGMDLILWGDSLAHIEIHKNWSQCLEGLLCNYIHNSQKVKIT